MFLQTAAEFPASRRMVIQARALTAKPDELITTHRRRMERAAIVPVIPPFAIRIAAPVLPY